MLGREFQLTRRDLLRGTSAALGLAATGRLSSEASAQSLPPSAINIEKDPTKIAEITRSLIAKINRMFSDSDTRVNATGYRISEGWHGQDNFKYIAFQRVIFQEEPSGRVNFWNTLDNMSEFGLDPKLDSGELGVTIPPMQRFNDRSTDLEGIFEERVNVLNMPKAMADYVREIRRIAETGVFTAFKDYGPYKVGRYQRGAVMEWTDGSQKGLVQGILAGDAANAAGLIPKEVQLDTPDLGSGGGGREISKNRDFEDRYVSPSGNSEIVNPASGAIGWKSSVEGMARGEEITQAFGLKGFKIIEVPGVSIVSERSRIVSACLDSSFPRCSSPVFMTWLPSVENGYLVIRYDILDPNRVFLPGELDKLVDITFNMVNATLMELGQDLNSSQAIALRRSLAGETNIRIVGPVITS
ncbi:MAG: twin-arginine translocation signal domain-containing protein [Candidatus Blackburnbacteria bacterium]|nr:twin-arginine translocation signal domain-containing protein [Candidatus Blackburnbacteria bacterium]